MIIVLIPCCRGLLKIVQSALAIAKRKVPVKHIVVGLEGDILKEEWV